MYEKQPTRAFLVPAEDYRTIADRFDEASLSAAYIGRWASREAFGLHLLADTSADRRLAELPRWLRGVVRLDADAFVADLEADGVYLLAPGQSGVHVFDAAAVRPKEPQQHNEML